MRRTNSNAGRDFWRGWAVGTTRAPPGSPAAGRQDASERGGRVKKRGGRTSDFVAPSEPPLQAAKKRASSQIAMPFSAAVSNFFPFPDPTKISVETVVAHTNEIESGNHHQESKQGIAMPVSHMPVFPDTLPAGVAPAAIAKDLHSALVFESFPVKTTTCFNSKRPHSNSKPMEPVH